VEDSFFHPGLFIKVSLPHFFKIDLAFTENDLEVPCLAGDPLVDEFHRVFRELEQKVTLDLGVVDALHTLDDLVIQFHDLLL
jgi:hypothetical protein